MTVAPLSSPLAADVLADGIAPLAEIVYQPMRDYVAKIIPGATATSKPTLILDLLSPPEDLCWALLDVMRLLTLGEDRAEHMRPIRHLALVQ